MLFTILALRAMYKFLAAVWRHPKRSVAAKFVALIGFLMVAAAAVLILLSIRADPGSHYNLVSRVVGGTGGLIAIVGWLASVFAPPLTKAQLDHVMEAHTERLEKSIVGAITAQTEVLRASHAEIIAALSRNADGPTGPGNEEK